MSMVVPKTQSTPKGMPDIPPEYLAMAAATMHAMGKFNKPAEETDARPNT